MNNLKIFVILTVSIFIQLINPALSISQDNLRKINQSLVEITERVMPSIVFLKVQQEISPYDNAKNPFQFRNPKKNHQFAFQIGSGVIINSKGYLVTNYHVVKDAKEVIVTLNNNEEYPAKIIGADPFSDIALLKLNTNNKLYQPAKLGNSDKLKVGELVLALGSPFGLRKTVTQGIVSAKGRKNAYGVNFIQTDAAINPGNSGGALVNVNGEVIGINSLIVTRAMYSGSAGFQGIGLAIPINLVKKIVKQLLKHGRVIRGYLGIRPANPDEASSKILNIKQGIMIVQVIPKSPAQQAGIKTWDIILKVNKTTIKDFDHLRQIVSETNVGKILHFTIKRNSKIITLKVKIGDLDKFLPQNKPKEKIKSKPLDLNDPSFGISVRDLTEEEHILLEKTFKEKHGVLVIDIKNHTLSDNSILTAGDLILDIEGEPVKDKLDFHAKIQKYYKNHFVRLRIIKRGIILIIPIKK